MLVCHAIERHAEEIHEYADAYDGHALALRKVIDQRKPKLNNIDDGLHYDIE